MELFMSDRNTNRPPRICEILFRRLLPDPEKQALLGDYEEIFKDLARSRGRFSASVWYTWQAFLTFCSMVSDSTRWSAAMLKNYLKIASRNIRRHKGYAFINIVGLAVGLACFILISLWVEHETSYDRFHEKKDRIFRLLNEISSGDFGAAVSYALGPELEAKYAEVEASCRVWPWHRSLVTYEEKRFDEVRFYLTDPSFFTVFTFPFIQGNPETALSDLHSIVITEATAERYFGDEDPMGKILHLGQPEADFHVTGVVQDVPTHSLFQFDFVSRVEHLGEDRLQRWEEWVASSYVLLHSSAEPKEVEKKIADIYEPHLSYKPDFWPVLQPLTRVHLYQSGRPGLIRQVMIFSVIAVFILIIACINFMNLTTARSVRRAKEVGLRKVTGAHRLQLIGQFFGESFVLSYLALILAVILVQFVLPAFNQFTGKSLNLMDDFFNHLFILVFVIVPLTGFIAGCYPALHLSAFRPAEVLRLSSHLRLKRSFLRQILVIFQFFVSISLIISTFIIAGQLQYIRKKDIGLDRNHVVVLLNNPDLNRRFDVFKSELGSQSGIVHVTAAAQYPMNVGQGVQVDWEGRQDDRPFVVKYTMVDYDFFETFKMDFVSGRSFSRSIPSDHAEACIINESLADLLGEGSPVGKQINFIHPFFSESERNVRVVGVVKDFHSESLHRSIRPFIFRIYRPFHQYVFVKIDPRSTKEALNHIEQAFNRFAPQYPFGYRFVDDAFENLYSTEKQLGLLFVIFGAMAIFISCLGLFGLTVHIVEQKTKEIGIRKSLGASIPALLILISKDLTRWVLISNLIAWPVAYLSMHRWLQNFAYRIDLSIWTFVLSGLVALVIAVLTLANQSIRAVTANPVDALKYE